MVLYGPGVVQGENGGRSPSVYATVRTSTMQTSPSPVVERPARSRAILVVPCYNEEQRLRLDAFAAFFAIVPDVDVIFVDDGSRDQTAAVILAFCEKFPTRAWLVQLPRNVGKAEAVRQGFLAALAKPADFVGFWDADLATPLDAVPSFLAQFVARRELEMVLGSRVLMLGRAIERNRWRHYAGRCFATIVSWILKLPTYDTQCGAKLFRVTPTLVRIFGSPFLSRWVFDVEILARLSEERARTGGISSADCVAELPLQAWQDVKGSKIGPFEIFRVVRDLWRIRRWYTRALEEGEEERANSDSSRHSTRSVAAEAPASPGPVLTPTFVLAVVALWGVATLRLFFTSGSGEHDTFMIAAGVVNGAQTGNVINPFCYDPGLQFLFYHLFHLFTASWIPSTANVLAIMNVAGGLSSLAIPFLLALVLAPAMRDPARARLAVLLFAVSPLYFFTVSYGHPFSVALPVFLLSWILLRPLLSPDEGRLGWPRIAAAVAIQAVALMIRFEQVALFGVLMLSLVALQRDRIWSRLAIAGGAFAAAVSACLVVRHALIPHGKAIASDIPVLFSILQPAQVRWGSVHLLSEVGLPLLAAGALVAFYAARRRNVGLLLVAVAGALPTMAVYIGNPSPPRHFYVASLGLATLIAAGVSSRRIPRWNVALPFILVANLTLPWALMAVDGRTYPDRAMVTYNALERTDRDKAQIRAAFPFYARLLEQAHGRRVVVFGSWIHVAELMSSLVEIPGTTIDRTSIASLKRAIEMRGRGVDVFAIETYDPAYVEAMEKDLRKASPGIVIISLVEGGPKINDLNLAIPPQIYWWGA
jgi:dolichyl-phosphate beta-glucosyltransferase